MTTENAALLERDRLCCQALTETLDPADIEKVTTAFDKWRKRKGLHAFANDVVDVVIAYSPADAVQVMEETTGQKYVIDDEGMAFRQLQDDDLYTLYEEELINPEPIPAGAVLIEKGEHSATYRATLRAWIDARGRCLLGSTEY